ncbi:hypothetical protein KY290_001486 [Solanum tuberosum]|uniref:Uncharacterized protein n=1 Tax=Solanum tuberosum TaxID=4113 RepID=A0ABQ7WP99_SOLTU|nr:hypothetical protein KY290_001486 [Solanum tuberosum]
MDEAPNSYMNIIDHQDLYSSTIPCANEFVFGEEAELSKIFDMTQEHHVNTTIISELPNVVPEEKQSMTTTNISSNSSSDKNSSRITYPITLDDDDDYSLSYIYSMGLKNVSMLQEDGGTSTNAINPETFIPMPIVMEKQGETTNDMILQKPLPKIPILEKFEREASLKSKFIIDQPLRTSTDFWKEEENHKTNDMSHILTLEKLESHFIKSKLMVGQENGILSSLDNEFPQSTRVGQNSSESMFNIPQKFNEYMQGYGYSNEAFTSRSLSSRKENEDGAPGELQSNSWNIQDSHFNTTTNWPWRPFH